VRGTGSPIGLFRLTERRCHGLYPPVSLLRRIGWDSAYTPRPRFMDACQKDEMDLLRLTAGFAVPSRGSCESDVVQRQGRSPRRRTRGRFAPGGLLRDYSRFGPFDAIWPGWTSAATV